MYRKFYGLARSPFDISPNPYFYYPTQRHSEALANLWYGIQHRKGCVVLTGEVGTGKTLLLRHVIDALHRRQLQCAYVFNPRLSPDDFLQYVLLDLGVKPNGNSRGQMLAQIHEHLINVYRQNSTVALIIDEAHLLSWDMFEEVRLLTNLETAQQKLLQILLVGQPELDRRLEAPELRQLKQRVTLRCRLEPLAEKEVAEYVAKRLELGGSSNPGAIFSPEALGCIMQYSHGIPRIINTICENSLISGYAKQAMPIGAEIVEEVAADFSLSSESHPLTPTDRQEQTVETSLLVKLAKLIQLMQSPTQDDAEINSSFVKGKLQ